MDFSNLALALGSSFGAGLNLYLTVLTLGALERFGWLQLPDHLQVVAHPWVMIAAGVLVLIEFVVDKVPYLDNSWDAVHSFVRIPAGAVLAASSFGDMPTHLVWVAALIGGFLSFSSHGAKASARLAVNASPEPFSNVALSLVEDSLAVTLLWLVTAYPLLAIVVTVLLVGVALGIIYLFFHLLKSVFRRTSSDKEPAVET